MYDENDVRGMNICDQRLGLTRRQFGQLTAAAGFASVLPRAASANAVEVVGSPVSITTSDGIADAYFVHPAQGKAPGVLVWPDALGLRPAFEQMAQRLAESGYAVLVVNPYYRTARAPVLSEDTNFTDEGTRTKLLSLMGALTPETNVTDAKAFVGWLDQQAAVDTSRKVGTAGYSMGGPMTMRTAAALPDRIGAAGSFHGSGLVTDDPNSPHLLVPKMKANYLFAIAENDDQKNPQVTAKALRQAFDSASSPGDYLFALSESANQLSSLELERLRKTFNVSDCVADIEVYEGTMHGWCSIDAPVYQQAQAEHALSRLLTLFETSLA